MQNTLSRLTLASIALLAVCLPAPGRGTASPFLADALLRARQTAVTTPGGEGLPLSANSRDVESYIAIVLQLESEEAPVPSFAAVLSRRGDLAAVSVPQSRLDELLSAPGVLRMESGVCAVPVMDEARKMCGLQQILDMPGHYRGRNVAVGFTDIGFDPNHVNFHANDGSSRVRRLVNYRGSALLPDRLTSAAEITSWTTDDDANWHATHVGGILAGSYEANGYYGVAPEAHIVATTSPLDAGYLLAGCEEVVAYAREQGVPAVINMSIASSVGSHDGTSLFNRYLQRVADDAVVCVSAGNSGYKWTGCIPFTATPEKPKVQALFRECPFSTPYEAKGIADMWSLTDRPFSVRILIYDALDKKFVGSIDTHDFTAGETQTVAATPDMAPAYGITPDETLAKYFASARVVLSSEVNPYNNRFNSVLSFEWRNRPEPEGVTTGHYWLGIEVTPAQGETVRMFASDRIQFMRPGTEYDPEFSNAWSINDLACGDGIMAVGAVTSRVKWPSDGEEYVAGPAESVGKVAEFSSFATLDNGKVLPDICAPGAAVVSSISTPYVNANHGTDGFCSVVTAGGRKNYWRNASGTSMSSPYTAGVFALMFEANPDLTPAEAIDIVSRTAIAPPDNDKRWGHGMLDAYAAVKAALEATGIRGIGADIDTPADIVGAGNGIWTVRGYGMPVADVAVHDMQGRAVSPRITPGADTATIDMNHLPAAIYLVTADVAGTTVSRKIAVR